MPDLSTTYLGLPLKNPLVSRRKAPLKILRLAASRRMVRYEK